MTTITRRLLPLLAAALALAMPSVASAKVFHVSRDVGVYAKPDLSKGISVIRSGGAVDVQCWTNGQPVGSYRMWDRIAFRGGTAYVHDKYVEMPNGKPADNGIPSCAGGGGEGGFVPNNPSQPGTKCVRGRFTTRYLSDRLEFQPDQSYTKVTWRPRLCKESDGWVLRDQPTLNQLSAGSGFGVGVDLEAADTRGATAHYHGQVMACEAFSISYSGISMSGESCVSAGKVDLYATVKGRTVVTRFKVKSRPSRLTPFSWTRNVL